MRIVRPVARDSGALGGRRVVAAQLVRAHDGAPCGTPFTHSYTALAFYTGGSSRVEQGGEWLVREGEVLLVPAGAPHRTLEANRPEYWGLAFHAPLYLSHGPASFLEPFERVRSGSSAVVEIPAARHGYLQGLLAELEASGREPTAASRDVEVVQRSLLTLVLAEVHGAMTSTRGARAAARSVVGEALRFIERHCLGPLTLGDVAAAVGRTPSHVTAALTRATGRSAGKWILSGRMAEARRLLLHSDERVDLIAERVGYADSTHFIRMFRREHGVTPAAWRAAQARAAGPERDRHGG